MAFSVLMSVYEKEDPAAFDRALKSNLDGQTLKPDQLVLVCDGPLNEALDGVIRNYQQKHPGIMKVCRLPENSGLGTALSRGLEQCDFDLVARADSDDVCVPERFALQVPYMEDHPQVAASSGAIDEFNVDPDCPQRVKHMPLTHEELCDYAKRRNPLNHMATIFRKSEVMAVGSYQHLQYLEDYYLWVRLIAAGKKLANLDDVLVHARVGNGMVDRRGDKRTIQSWKVLGRYMRENGLQSAGEFQVNMVIVTLWCYMPSGLREVAYKTLLRKRGNT